MIKIATTWTELIKELEERWNKEFDDAMESGVLDRRTDILLRLKEVENWTNREMFYGNFSEERLAGMNSMATLFKNHLQHCFDEKSTKNLLEQDND